MASSNAENIGLLRIVEDAAGQNDFLELDRIDTDSDVYDVIYAVDSNIVHLYVAPFGMATASLGRGRGYGEVFRDDDAAQKGAIAAALAHFLWNHLANTDRPLLLIPPIDVEVSLLEVTAQRYLDDAYFDMELMNSIVHKLLSKSEINITETQNLIRQMHKLIIDANRAKRYFDIRERRCFEAVDSITLDDERLPGPVTRVIQPLRSVRDMIKFSQKRELWIKRLETLGRDLDIRLERDAEALSRLEMWNDVLRYEQTNCRVVYITGDASLLHAASEFKLSRDPRAPEGHRLQSEHSFRDAYLRHPRCFLDRPGVLHKALDESDRTNSLYEWLGLLLGDFEEIRKPLGEWQLSHFVLDDAVSARVAEVERNEPEAGVGVITSWADFTQRTELVAFQDMDPSKALEELKAASRGEVYRLTQVFEEVFERIGDDVISAWEACVRVFTEVRLISDILSKRSRPTRRPPPVLLEGDAAEAFMEAARHWIEHPDEFSAKAFEKIKRKVDDDDRSGYNFLVGVARILAQGQHWPSAGFLCAHARLIADREVKRHGLQLAGPNGREARFLEAVCRRHSARKLDDLESIDELLQSGIEIAAQEERKWPCIDAVSERFTAEQFALELTRFFIAWSDRGVSYPSVKTLSEDIYRFFQEMQVIIADTNRITKRRDLMLTRQRIAVNLVSLGMLFPEEKKLQDMAEEAYRYLVQCISELAPSESSRYIDVLLKCGGAVFGEETQRAKTRRDVREEIDAWLNDLKSETVASFPYERARLKAFLSRLGDPPSSGSSRFRRD